MSFSESPQPSVFSDERQRNLPNATATLILGIVSIPSCCCAGIAGLVCGIVALVISNKDLSLYAQSPNSYTPASYKNLKAGRVCAIIGVILSSLYAVWTIIAVSLHGIDGLTDNEIFKNFK